MNPILFIFKYLLTDLFCFALLFPPQVVSTALELQFSAALPTVRRHVSPLNAKQKKCNDQHLSLFFSLLSKSNLAVASYVTKQDVAGNQTASLAACSFVNDKQVSVLNNCLATSSHTLDREYARFSSCTWSVV